MLPSYKTKYALRSIHEPFQPFLPQNAHGYCVMADHKRLRHPLRRFNCAAGALCTRRAPFATPWTFTLLAQHISAINVALGGAALPPFAVFHILIACLPGSIAVRSGKTQPLSAL
jgi:hypothetical protein